MVYFQTCVGSSFYSLGAVGSKRRLIANAMILLGLQALKLFSPSGDGLLCRLLRDDRGIDAHDLDEYAI
jgi:hypothetical protein